MPPLPARPSGFFALRTPLLPVDVLEDWADGLRCAATPGDRSLWERDLAAARRRLRALFDDPVVREAVFLASPSLEERASAWFVDRDPDDGVSGVEIGLVKYVTRMATRCTPFGLFAGNSVGTIGRETKLELLDRDASVRHTRLDMEFLDEVVTRLAADPTIRRQLRFSPNTSLYEVGGTFRYAEARTVSGRRAYFLVDVEPHDALRQALERARHGATLAEIAERIAANDDEIDEDTAHAFAEQLVDAKLLVPELGPVVTGAESAAALVAQLVRVPAAATLRSILAATQSALIDMDAEGPGAAPARYHDLMTAAAALAPVDSSHFVQVDLTKTAAVATLDASLADELLRATQTLLDLFAHGRTDPLAEFRRAFEERYGDHDVPLAEALDEEIGIGFQMSHAPGADASPLLAGLSFPTDEETERVAWGSRGRFLAWRLSEAIATGAEELVLDAKDLARFHDPTGPALADAFHVLATILPHGANDADDANEVRAVIDSAGGPSGVRLLGRFCHGDPELRAHVEEHLRAEERLEPNVRWFEIVHLPEGRTGNVLARPVLRDLELEFLGRSGAPRDRTIRIDDLFVAVRNGRVVLSSRSLDCEVRPRMTTAHNTQWRSLGVYRFLAALQAEGRVEGASWSWGPLESQPRLPRVRLGRVVLARAQWNVPKPELDELRAHRDHEAFRVVQAWRGRRGLPRFVGVADQDNVLTIDFDHPLSVAAFLDELRGREIVTLQETLPAGAAFGPEGRYANEVVIPYVRPVPEAAAVPPEGPPSDAAPATGRVVLDEETVFAPGSEWLTVKLYAGPSLGDAVLTDLVAPIARDALASGVIDRWFFLRFGDPDWHVRVRFHGSPLRLTTELLPALTAAADPWLADRRVHRVQLDTYVRETRRYGGPQAIVACEDVFFGDSAMVATFLAEAPGDDGLDLRWRFAFVAMDRMLHDLGYDLAAKHGLVGRLAELYGAEFRLDGDLRAELRDRYRAERRALDDALAERGDAGAALGRAYDLLRERGAVWRDACEKLGSFARAGRLTVPPEEIAASFLHMHANRCLRSAHRAQEMILYRFLEKSYASMLARRRVEVPRS